MDHSPHPIRQLETLDEFSAVVALQQEIWGFEDVELLPRRLFVVASKIGGQVLGAYHQNDLIAFCLCLPGLKPGGKSFLYSHMLGVRPEYRNTGLGRILKLRQREYAMSRGVDLIEWTFDPLEIKNAFFNIEKLGAIVRRFVANQYGTTTSHLHGGLPTDRLVAEWHLYSPRAVAAAEGTALPPIQAEGPVLRIAVPAQIAQLRMTHPETARGVQRRVGSELDELLGKGFAVVGFEKSREFGTYLLGQWESD